MKIYKNEELVKLKKKEINPKTSIFQFDLELKKIYKLPIEILYINLTYGIEKFILNYDIEKIKIPQSKIIEIIKKDLYKLIKLKKFKIYFKNFAKCIILNNLIPYRIKYEIKDYIEMYEDKFNIEKNEKDKYTKIDICNKCDLNKNCIGILKEYKNMAKDEITKPIILNKTKTIKIQKKILEFKNKEIIKLSEIILNDFGKDTDYLKKTIVFVESFPKNLEESSIERITYYIYNQEKDWNDNEKLIKNIFKENNKINEILKIIKNEKLIVISISLMGNQKIRKTFYSTINNLKKEEIKKINEIFNLNLKKEYSIGLDFIENKLKSIKKYNKKEKIKKEELFEFISDIELKNKKKTLKILDFLPNEIDQVLLDFKKKENNKNQITKRIDISAQFNEIDFNPILKIIKIPEDFLKDKEIYTFSIELNNKTEKFNFYYVYS